MKISEVLKAASTKNSSIQLLSERQFNQVTHKQGVEEVFLATLRQLEEPETLGGDSTDSEFDTLLRSIKHLKIKELIQANNEAFQTPSRLPRLQHWTMTLSFKHNRRFHPRRATNFLRRSSRKSVGNPKTTWTDDGSDRPRLRLVCRSCLCARKTGSVECSDLRTMYGIVITNIGMSYRDY